jgi:hypothetical protein
MSWPGSTGLSSNHRQGVLDCLVKPGNDKEDPIDSMGTWPARRQNPGCRTCLTPFPLRQIRKAHGPRASLFAARSSTSSSAPALAAAFWIGAAQFDEADASGIGAATFPRGIAVLLGVAAATLVVRAVAALSGRIPSTITVTERPGSVIAGMGLVILFLC